MRNSIKLCFGLIIILLLVYAIPGAAQTTFTADELSIYDGKGTNPAYVALEGVVYDVTLAEKWIDGIHTPCGGSVAGTDITSIWAQAPQGHFSSSFMGMFPVVGTLAASDSPPTVPANKKVLRFYIDKTDYYIDGQVQAMDTAPIIKDDRTLLPIRYVATPFGASVDWNEGEQKVTVSLNNKIIELWIGQATAKVNGIAVQIDPNNSNVTPIVVPPGRTMLPLRFISESLGSHVDWEQSSQMITVTYPADDTDINSDDLLIDDDTSSNEDNLDEVREP